MSLLKRKQPINPSELTVLHELVEFSRDEERENGIAVSYVTCDFRDKHLVFRMCGRRAGEEIDWYLRAPPYARKELGDLWCRRKELFSMVLDRLREMDSVSDFWWGRRSFQNLTVDMSDVQSWHSYQLDLAKQRLRPLTRRLPGKYSAPPLAAGWLVLLLAKWSANPWMSTQAAGWCAAACGLIGLAMLKRDFKADGLVLRWAEAMANLSKGRHDPPVRWIRTTLRHHGTRYGVTVTLATGLVWLGLWS